MASGGMTQDLASYDWIVLPHVRERELWVAGIEEAVQAAGRTVHDWDASQDLTGSKNALVMTASTDVAMAHQPDVDRIAAIAGELDVAVPSGLSDIERHLAVQAATDSFAQLSALPPARVLGRDNFAKGTAAIAPGLCVAMPAFASAPSRLANALAVFTQKRAIWSSDILSWNVQRSTGDEGVTFDLTGRPRILVFGPYIVMPKGRWRAVFQLAFDDYAARYLFRADWGGVESYKSQEFRPVKPGVFELEMTHDWAQRGACEFRLLVLEGVFHGQVTVSDIRVSKID